MVIISLPEFYKETGREDCGGKPYREILAFRDYLRKHRKKVKKFFGLKLKWGKEAGGDRGEYGRLKGKYVKKILRERFV